MLLEPKEVFKTIDGYSLRISCYQIMSQHFVAAALATAGIALPLTLVERIVPLLPNRCCNIQCDKFLLFSQSFRGVFLMRGCPV
jgi:hypothetical protein